MNRRRNETVRVPGTAPRRLVAVAIGLAFAAPSQHVFAQDAPKCAAAVGSEVRALGKFAAQGQDKCHGLANKVAVVSGFCNDVNGAPLTVVDGGKYVKARSKSLDKLHGPSGKCPSPQADAALDVLPGGNLVNKLGSIEELVTERGDTVLGGANLGGDANKIRCFKAISATRRAVADKMMNTAITCQKKNASPGQALLPTCLDDTSLASFLAARSNALQAACTGLSGAQVGSCEPLPDCVIEAALAEGKVLASHAYPGETCTKGTPAAQARTASVSINTPTDLGGITVLIRYPRFDAGIPENGSDIDPTRITNTSLAFIDAFDLDDALKVSALDPNGFASGHLFDVEFDVCRPLIPEGLCSVTTSQACTAGNQCRPPACSSCLPANQCTISNAPCSTDADCGPSGGTCGEKCLPQGRSCSLSQFLNCQTDADCPLTETCLSQRALTTCSVEAASDPSGNPVEGVSCTVVISEP